MNELKLLIEQAGKIYSENFSNNTCFERALFFSWSCAIKDCTFCFMSVQEKKNKNDDDKSLRSKESIYAEAIICKQLGWPIGFFSGGINSYKKKDLLEMITVIHEITGEKIWLNIGSTPREWLEEFKPHIIGVVGSIETINPVLHKKVCPSKPIEPYVRMFNNSTQLGLKNAINI